MEGKLKNMSPEYVFEDKTKFCEVEDNNKNQSSALG